MTHTLPFESLSDAALLDEAQRLASVERHAAATLIACLVEVDARRLYLAQGCSSLFGYCTSVLRLSEHAAYARIEATRCARRVPRILDLLAEGAITLTTVTLIAAHLTPDNQQVFLEAVRGKSRCEVERLLAELKPQPDLPAKLRKLPEPRPTPRPADRGLKTSATGFTLEVPVAQAFGPAMGDGAHVPGPEPPDEATRLEGTTSVAASSPVRVAQQPRPVIAPVAPRRYKLQLTVTEETHHKLRSLQDLLRHANPSGDLAVILDRALTLLLEHVKRQKFAATARPRACATPTRHTRYVPSAVKRAVWIRDAGQCAFVGEQGRCPERGFLEYHHLIPFADGGQAEASNIALRWARPQPGGTARIRRNNSGSKVRRGFVWGLFNFGRR
jgi:hypothetical protein